MAKRKPNKKKPQPLGYPVNPNAGTALISLETPKPGRSSFWLDKERIEQFGALLANGSTDRDACELMGLSQGRFYCFLQVGRAVLGLETMPDTAPQGDDSRQLCKEFLEEITRARAKARQKATNTVMKAIAGQTTGEITTRTYEETRLDKEGKPYQYVEVTRTERIINIAPDPKTALEYLARRDKAHWSERLEVQAVPFEQKVVEMIKAGALDYDSLVDEFKDSALVLSWFQLAGVNPVKNGEK